jgi:hypothetical protein
MEIPVLKDGGKAGSGGRHRGDDVSLARRLTSCHQIGATKEPSATVMSVTESSRGVCSIDPLLAASGFDRDRHLSDNRGGNGGRAASDDEGPTRIAVFLHR